MIESFKEPSLEGRGEKMPFEADLRIDFIRHGMPAYTPEELEAGEVEGKLTPKGIEQIKDSALKLAEEIDKEKEIIVIWTSPKNRARQSAEIISDVFKEMKIPVLEKGWKKEKENKEESGQQIREVKSLKDVGVGVGSLKKLKELTEKEELTSWMEYWARAEDLPEEIETPEAVKIRTERLITYLERIARAVHPSLERKLHFICVGHEETVRDLLEEAYGIGTKKGEGPIYGEALRIDINKSTDEKDAVMSLNYGDEKAVLGFNKDSRKFYRSVK